MNNAGRKIVVGGICRPDGAWRIGGVLATKMPLLTELVHEGVERMVMIVMAATEWRKKVAHSTSCGLGMFFGTSSVGAAENTDSLTGNFLSPFQGFAGLFRLPTVCTVGYHLSLLRS